MESYFYARNRQRLAELLSDESLTILFAGKAPFKTADEHYRFVPNRNFYYLTGIDEANVTLVIKKSGNETKEILFIEKANPFMEKWVGKTVSKEEAEQITGIFDVRYHETFETFLTQSFFTENIKQVNLDLERREWTAPKNHTLQFASHIRDHFPHVLINNVYHEISELRVYKTPEEIQAIKESIAVTKEGIYNLMKHAKPGMMEYQLEAHFDFVLKSNGVRDYAFNTITASGKNATILHYEDNNAQTNSGDLVLLDLGAQKNYYSADISYTFPIDGTFTDRQKQLYNIVLKALKETTELIRPGVKFAELNKRTKEILAAECKKIGLINEEEEISNYYYHSVSHFLGLDTHDVGSYKDRILEPGMVLTVEPGLYIEEEAIGIRIEDDILVTEDGYENLSKDIIRTVEEIETFMKTRQLEEVKN